MRKEKCKSYLAGLLTAIMVFTLCGTSLAAPIKKQLAATFNNIKIYVDGSQVTPKDSAGKAVEPFVVDGTTYLPVRAVASALGKEVAWDGATQSVYIGKVPESVPVSKITAPGTVILDRDGIKVTYNGVSASDSYLGGFNVKLLIENNTKNAYTVQVRDFSVNSFMTDTVFSCDVAAEKKASDAIIIPGNSLKKNGIVSIENAEFSLHIFDSKDWETSYDSPVIHIQCK